MSAFPQYTISRFEKIPFVLLSLAIFIFIAIRSAVVGFSNDEAVTFLNFIHTNEFLPFFDAHWTANNHYVNSFFSWISYRLFGMDEWALRLPNLLSLPLYFWFLFQMGKKLGSPFLRWGFWLMFFCSYYLLEFFGYCRGYGLSLAFPMGAIHHLVRGIELNSDKYLKWSLLYMALATFANLNLLISFLIWTSISQLWILSSGNWKSKSRFHIYTVIPLLAAIIISFVLKSRSELYIGQISIKGTVFTIMSGFSGIISEHYLWMLLIGLSVLALLATFISFKFIWNKPFQINLQMAFTTILVLNVVAVQLMSWLLDVPFPSGRTALHWYPLFIGTFTFTLDRILPRRMQYLSWILFPLIIWPQLNYAHKIANLHISADPFWALEQIPDSFYHTLVDEFSKYENPPTLYASTSFYTYILAHKNLKFKGDLIPCQDFKAWDPHNLSDYLILHLSDFPDFIPLYDTIQYDPYSQMSILKRKDFLKKSRVSEPVFTSHEETDDRWLPLGEVELNDSLVASPLQLDFDLNISTQGDPTARLVTFQIVDSLGAPLYYNQYRIDYRATDFSDGVRSRANMIIDEVPQGSKSLKVLYWNINSEAFTLNSSRIDVYKLSEK